MKRKTTIIGKKAVSLILSAAMTIAGTQLSFAKTVSKSTSGKTYSSTSGGNNAVLVSGKKVTLKKAKIRKSGSSNSENADFNGTNAAVLAKNGAKVSIRKSKVTTNGNHANGVFCYGSGTNVTVSNTTIKTTGNCSGGIMTTGGGTMTAKNLKVTTSGNSSAAIRTDRGGGTVKVTGGKFVTGGVGSPAVYSTANIIVNKAVLNAKKSEAVVIEGGNSVTLNNTTLTGNNSVLNGQSQVKTNVLIYQSMSGDASEGNSTFTMTGGKMTCKTGAMFYVTNTTTTINLNKAKLVNAGSSVLLKASTGPWGRSGKNGGHVTLNAKAQTLKGDISIGSQSTLSFNLNSSSNYTGKITGSGTTSVTIDSGSTWTLTGDSSVKSLSNNGTIRLNGHTLTVNGKVYKQS